MRRSLFIAAASLLCFSRAALADAASGAASLFNIRYRNHMARTKRQLPQMAYN